MILEVEEGLLDNTEPFAHFTPQSRCSTSLMSPGGVEQAFGAFCALVSFLPADPDRGPPLSCFSRIEGCHMKYGEVWCFDSDQKGGYS